MIKPLKILFGITLGICLAAAGAQASITLDFTHSAYYPGVMQPTKTVFNVLGDIDIKFTALGATGSNPYLTWYTSSSPDAAGGNDGFGVYGGGGYEEDEVELPEVLLVEFSNTVFANSFNLRDYFIEQRNGHTYAEIGLYSINGGGWDNIDSATASSGNGLSTLILNQQIDSIAFTALGDVAGSEDHEFSVAGADIAQVPVPPAILLLESGPVGLAGIRKKFKR